MQTSTFLAKLIGPFFLVVGLGMLVNSDGYRRMADEVLRSDALVYLSGLLILAAGLALILSHNVWTADWRILITLIGWLAALGGAARIIIPHQSQDLGRKMLAPRQALAIAGAIWLAIGALLCFFGYFR